MYGLVMLDYACRSDRYAGGADLCLRKEVTYVFAWGFWGLMHVMLYYFWI
jgi:hypothetical protein